MGLCRVGPFFSSIENIMVYPLYLLYINFGAVVTAYESLQV